MTDTHPNHKWWTLFAMCFALFMIMLDNTVVNVALPSIQHDLRPTPQALEWTVNAYILTFAVLIPLGGKLGDRFGRKRLFLVGLAVFTIASAACALASTDGQLIAARALQGVGGAMLNPLSLSIIVAAFPRRELPGAIGIWAGISALGLAIGPLLGGFLIDAFDWSAVFWINVPIGVLAAGATLWAVRESRDPRSRSLDLFGTSLVTAALFALVWGLIETTTHDWTSAYTLAFLGSAVVLGAAFVAWEARSTDPMIPLEFFGDRTFTISSAVTLLVGFSLFGVIFFITLFFQNVLGYSAREAGVRTLPLTMMTLVFAPIAGRLNGKIGPRPLVTFGMLTATVALLGLSQMEPGSSYSTIWPFFSLLGIGIAFTMPSAAAAGMAAVDSARAGIASAVINTSRQVGGALGVAVFGAVASTLATDRWESRIAAAGLDAGQRAAAGRLEELVVGGQAQAIGAAAGPQAQAAAADAFAHGMHGAMWVAAGLTLTAAATGFVGLRGARRRAAEAERAPVVAEL